MLDVPKALLLPKPPALPKDPDEANDGVVEFPKLELAVVAVPKDPALPIELAVVFAPKLNVGVLVPAVVVVELKGRGDAVPNVGFDVGVPNPDGWVFTVPPKMLVLVEGEPKPPTLPAEKTNVT